MPNLYVQELVEWLNKLGKIDTVIGDDYIFDWYSDVNVDGYMMLLFYAVNIEGFNNSSSCSCDYLPGTPAH